MIPRTKNLIHHYYYHHRRQNNKDPITKPCRSLAVVKLCSLLSICSSDFANLRSFHREAPCSRDRPGMVSPRPPNSDQASNVWVQCEKIGNEQYLRLSPVQVSIHLQFS